MTKKRLTITKLENGKSEVEIKPCTVGELAEFYQIDRTTMRTQIKHLTREIGKRSGYYYTIEQVRKIIEELGIPRKIIFESDQIRES